MIFLDELWHLSVVGIATVESVCVVLRMDGARKRCMMRNYGGQAILGCVVVLSCHMKRWYWSVFKVLSSVLTYL